MRAKREDGRVSAILHEEFPVRFWDHDLGPDRTRLFTTEIPDGDAEWELRDLTGHIGAALNDECTWDLTPDGRTVVATWVITEPGGSLRRTLVAIDVATGERRILADDPDHEYDSPRLSPDGTLVAVCVRKRLTPEDPGDLWLGLVPVAGGELRALAAEWDRWPRSPRWTPDGTALVVAADDQGRSPLWRVDVATGHPVRLTADNGTYTDFYVSPDGHWVYARRSAIDSPPAPVRLALDGLSAAERLPHPAEPVALPGRLEEVTTLAEDGTPVRGWLAVPHGASAEAPAPLLVSIHGGPVMSAKDWSWGWNPWPAVARGYAVLQPDFALSTGYGIDFIRRGWGQWGGTPYTDVTSITDAAQERPEIDPERAAAMGASFGGYMANWIAGHTNRFKAIVTHASIWSLDQSIGASDISYFFTREMTAEAADAHSPHHFADAMTTPMLITHGDKDYRVPISEALQLWWALSSRWKAENSPNPHKFLYFPGENHFILKPNNVKVWYTTYLTFLDHHVRGEKWQRPDLLG
jgi:dipeptidyl aminopeptidase/acylaminoacyl peptidase